VRIIFGTVYSVWKAHGEKQGAKSKPAATATAPASPLSPSSTSGDTILIVDEASQVSMPLAALLYGALSWTRVVVAGDFKQLPPIIHGSVTRSALMRAAPANVDATFPKNLLPRIAAQAQALLLSSVMTIVAGTSPESVPVGVVQLDVSFRSHPSVVAFVGAIYPTLASTQRNWLTHPVANAFAGPRFRLVNLAAASPAGLRTSEMRAVEVSHVAAFVQDLPETWSVGIVTVHRNQRLAIRSSNFIASRDPALTKVDTVDSMQGQEFDAVVIALAAVSPVFAMQLQRLNVAFSRAKWHIAVVTSNILEDAACAHPNATDDTLQAAEYLRRFRRAAVVA
jgi:superfamily I DNA and/or RNA helicase